MKLEEQYKILYFKDLGDERGNLVVNVGGSSKVKVDNGTETAVIELNRPGLGLYLPPMLWKDMYDFSPDSILLVLASRHYDEHEYIRDYSEYLREIKGDVR